MKGFIKYLILGSLLFLLFSFFGCSKREQMEEAVREEVGSGDEELEIIYSDSSAAVDTTGIE